MECKEMNSLVSQYSVDGGGWYKEEAERQQLIHVERSGFADESAVLIGHQNQQLAETSDAYNLPEGYFLTYIHMICFKHF